MIRVTGIQVYRSYNETSRGRGNSQTRETWTKPEHFFEVQWISNLKVQVQQTLWHWFQVPTLLPVWLFLLRISLKNPIYWTPPSPLGFSLCNSTFGASSPGLRRWPSDQFVLSFLLLLVLLTLKVNLPRNPPNLPKPLLRNPNLLIHPGLSLPKPELPNLTMDIANLNCRKPNPKKLKENFQTNRANESQNQLKDY